MTSPKIQIDRKQGCSIFLINTRRQFPLILRDDIPTIAFPSMWDLPGGLVERGESPHQAIVRDMQEEMGLRLEDVRLFRVYDLPDRMEHCFWQPIELDLARINLTEGQRLEWFTENRAAQTELAFGFNPIVADFFSHCPFDV